MAPRGGYSRNRAVGIEYVPVGETLDAEGKIMANAMGQTYPVWVADAITHHIYRCELLLLAEQYRQDCETSIITPQNWEEKYQPKRAKPTITKSAGKASTVTGRTPRPNGSGS